MKQQAQAIGNDHERSDAHVAPLVQFLIWLAIVCAVSFFLMKWLLGWFKEQDTPIPGNVAHPLAAERVVPPEPRLERARNTQLLGEGRNDGAPFFTSQSLAGVHAQERERLTSYGWVDKQNGIVHIPIERAIELTLQQGLPVAPAKK